jgi:hypothetical protein
MPVKGGGMLICRSDIKLQYFSGFIGEINNGVSFIFSGNNDRRE